MSQFWTIVSVASGEVLAPCFATASAAVHPRDAGWSWDAATQRAHPIAAAPDPTVQAWTGTAWTESAAAVERRLIAALKLEAERRKMLVRSPGSGKGAEYRRKRDEAMASANVVASVLNALTRPEGLKQYPAAAMEAALTGEAMATVLARYRDASTAADSEVLRISALEQSATRRIKTAGTAAAKRAAFAAIDWSWRP